MNWYEIKIWYLLAGLGLFLFGISLLEESIKAIAGRSFKTFLQKQTGHPVKAVLAGALTTGVMQSSSMVILLVMSFTGAGIIGLKNGIGMILGANLGTTITGWMVALLGFKFNLESLYLPVIAIGSLSIIFFSNSKLQQTGKLLFGFGLMFMGLNFMKEGFLDFAKNADLSILVGKPMILFLLFGFILAAAIRSSSASMMIFMTSLASGSIDLMQAGFLAVGADLGTTVTGILGTINGNAVRKKTGWAQFYINVITAIVTLILIKQLFGLIDIAGIKDPLVALVSFHTLFNLLGIIIILPFIGKFSALIDKLISSDFKTMTKNLPFVNPKDVLSSMYALEAEVLLFIRKAAENRKMFFTNNDKDVSLNAYNTLKSYENEIFNQSRVLLENKLSLRESDGIQTLFSGIRSATLAVKDIKDVQHNLEECSQSGNDDIFNLYNDLKCREEIFDTNYDKLLRDQTDQERINGLISDNEKNYDMMKEIAFK
ncbi:MAG: Na/Pi cotransporter family protein, partial [Saprospiraceae bacterium]|nr:Na/Pi cotransporter family protein [Saprospiraceae bacterium]